MEETRVPSRFKRTFGQGVRIDEAGRVVVPAPIRKALGIRGRQMLHISLDDGFIRLQTVEAGLERIREIARSRGKSSKSVVDDFIAERRAEAAKEWRDAVYPGRLRPSRPRVWRICKRAWFSPLTAPGPNSASRVSTSVAYAEWQPRSFGEIHSKATFVNV